LGNDLAKVVGESEVIVVATRVDRDELRRLLRPDQKVIDLVNLDKARRPTAARPMKELLVTATPL